MRFCMKLLTLPLSTLLHQPTIRSIHKTKCSLYPAGSKSGSENGISVAKQEYWSDKSLWLLHVHSRWALKSYPFCADLTFMLCMALRTNSDYFPTPLQLIDFCNQRGMCLLHGTSSVFNSLPANLENMVSSE